MFMADALWVVAMVHSMNRERKMNRMDDLISRQAAIDVLEERLQANGYSNVALVSELNRSIGYLMRLPSAERHGRWIKKYRGNYLCSVCGAWYRTTDDYGNIIDGEMLAKYCEDCGAKMDGDTE